MNWNKVTIVFLALRGLKKYILHILLALTIITGGWGAYYYDQYRLINSQYKLLKENPQKITEKESKNLIAAIGNLIVLPTGEEPTIATVADLSKLKNQPFFAKATKGDKVLIYNNAKRAILYNPASNKIIEVAPLNTGSASQTGVQVYPEVLSPTVLHFPE